MVQTFLTDFGLSLPEIRLRKLKKRKIVELDPMLEHIPTIRALLDEQGKCCCTALEECGKKMFEKQCGKT